MYESAPRTPLPALSARGERRSRTSSAKRHPFRRAKRPPPGFLRDRCRSDPAPRFATPFFRRTSDTRGTFPPRTTRPPPLPQPDESPRSYPEHRPHRAESEQSSVSVPPLPISVPAPSDRSRAARGTPDPSPSASSPGFPGSPKESDSTSRTRRRFRQATASPGKEPCIPPVSNKSPARPVSFPVPQNAPSWSLCERRYPAAASSEYEKPVTGRKEKQIRGRTGLLEGRKITPFSHNAC